MPYAVGGITIRANFPTFQRLSSTIDEWSGGFLVLVVLLVRRGIVGAVIDTLHFLDHLLHLLVLLLPLGLGHLCRFAEHFGVGSAIASPDAIPEGGILTVVVVEGKVVDGVARGTVDDGIIRHVLPVVDHDGPDVDKEEKGDVG